MTEIDKTKETVEGEFVEQETEAQEEVVDRLEREVEQKEVENEIHFKI